LVLAFGAASRFFAEAVGLVPASAWPQPGLGDWTVVELVGHGNRAHTTLEEYLLRPRPPEPAGSSYFSDEAVGQRGREAVAALGDHPAAVVEAASGRAITLVERTPANATIGSPAGTMTLGAYLPSRISELTIHGLDVAAALGRPELTPPAPALVESLRYVTGRLVKKGEGQIALLALAGRAVLPPGLSAY
jgi:uncharacterized protein (TIGR03083 family)